MVQFAYYKHRNRHVPVAIKFFLSTSDYEEEAAMYASYSTDLHPFMPKNYLMQDNRTGEVCNALPPHIVLERGKLLPALAANVDVLSSAKVRFCLCVSARDTLQL